MFIMFPVAWPASKLLDWALEGERGATVYRRGELKALIGLHEDGQGGGELSADEVNIIRATLDLSNKSVRQVMTPLEDVYMLSLDKILDRASVREIKSRGHSRIPVYDGARNNVRAMFLVKNLIDYDVNECHSVRQFPLMFLPIISGDTNVGLLSSCRQFFLHH
jgi:CBS domain containing-hemolysin-like protein